MKKLTALLVFAFSYTHTIPTVDPTFYTPTAQNWCKMYLMYQDGTLKLSAHDLNLLANLFHFSLQRSLATLEAQEIMPQAFRVMWKSWQNIAQTRRNPSLDTPFELQTTHAEQILKSFLEAQVTHRRIGATYAECLEYIVNGNHLDETTQKGIADLRATARTVIIEAFLDIKKILGELINYASEHVLKNYESEFTRFDIAQANFFFYTIFHYANFFKN